MTELPADAQTPAPSWWASRAAALAARVRRRWRSALTGAAAATLAWIALILLGVPKLVGGEGHDATLFIAVLGALVGISRGRAMLNGLAGVLAFTVAVIAYTPVIEEPLHRLIRADGPPARPLAAVFVLSEGVTSDSLLRQQGLDRLLYGIELVRSGIAPLLVVTRFDAEDGGRIVNPAVDQMHLARLIGLDSARVLVVDSVTSTRGEAVLGKRLLAARRIQRIALVTSPAHSSRACRTFERAGFFVTCMPSRSRDVPFGRGALFHTTDRLRAFQLWLYETAATALYARRGWI